MRSRQWHFCKRPSRITHNLFVSPWCAQFHLETQKQSMSDPVPMAPCFPLPQGAVSHSPLPAEPHHASSVCWVMMAHPLLPAKHCSHGALCTEPSAAAPRSGLTPALLAEPFGSSPRRAVWSSAQCIPNPDTEICRLGVKWANKHILEHLEPLGHTPSAAPMSWELPALLPIMARVVGALRGATHVSALPLLHFVVCCSLGFEITQRICNKNGKTVQSSLTPCHTALTKFTLAFLNRES